MGVGKVACLDMLAVNRSGYYSWEKSTQKEGGRKYEIERENRLIQEAFFKVIEKIGYVPGARTFRVFLRRDHSIDVSVERCRYNMKAVKLTPHYGKPPKHAGKKEKGMHGHICAAEENLLQRDFFKGPRKVVLTDITYLYIEEFHKVIYLCVFYDVFTKEVLGWALQGHMTVGLVREAYDMMMELHGSELRGSKVYIHSDQGCQYTSTTYRQLLKDEGFIQSMSDRGNSQDNAPMESFFGRMKSRIMNLVATCPDFKVAHDLIKGYLDEYNNVLYQHDLAGLTPAEFYKFTQTGIYPLDSYFGVDASRLDDPEQLMMDIRLRGLEHNAKERKAYAGRKKLSERLLTETPEDVVLKDRKILEKRIACQKRIIEKAQGIKDGLEHILELTNRALEFIRGATEEVINELKNPDNWKKYPQLAYVYEMNGMQ